jgi:8-oxo-dGTP diphosphatase
VPRQTDVIRVAAGILLQSERILVAERVGGGQFQGLWEFPGGKIEADESADTALCRELKEELDVEATRFQPFMALDHRYADRHVQLEFFLVSQWSGQVRSVEGQELRWVSRAELRQIELLPADRPVVDALCALKLAEV